MKRRIRTSERATFNRCRQQWWWSYIEQRRGAVDVPPLRFGYLIHQALEARYPVGSERGPHPAKTFAHLFDRDHERMCQAGWQAAQFQEAWEPHRQLGIAMMNNFVEHWGYDDDWVVLATEHTFDYPVRHKGKTIFHYVGRLDGVWQHRHSGLVVMVDWKTTSSISTQYLAMDEQAGAYLAYGAPALVRQGLLDKRDIPKAMLYRFLRKALPDERPYNELGQYLNNDGSVSKRQPAAYFAEEMVYRDQRDMQRLRYRVLQQAAQMSATTDLPDVLLYKNPSKMHCSTCPFRDPCEVHETQGDYLPLLKHMTQQWDPYSRDEIELEGMDLVYS